MEQILVVGKVVNDFITSLVCEALCHCLRMVEGILTRNVQNLNKILEENFTITLIRRPKRKRLLVY